MPLRAFVDSDVTEVKPEGQSYTVLMPLRAFVDSDVTEVRREGQSYSLNALTGIC